MNELRITLAILGLVILAAIYFLGTHFARSKKSPASGSRRRRLLEDEALDLSSMPRESEEDKDLSKALTDLGGLFPNREGGGKARPVSVKSPQPTSRSRGGGKKDNETTDLFGGRGEGSDTKDEAKQEQVIVLYLTPSPGAPFSGRAILDAAKSVGMRFGDMGVFHHYGLKEMDHGVSLFCLVNMFEPGNFDLKQMDAFQTRGLALFMRPSSAMDNRVVFELMLNTAQRLKARLGGELRDAQHEPLVAAEIERMRRQVIHGQP